jgi:membrane associated rhomboid family serine protease
MLYDRPYMQDTRSSGRTTVLGWLILAILAGYVLQAVVSRIFDGGDLVERLFALTPAALRAGHVWTLFTYGFLHAQGLHLLLHIAVNLLGLYFLGRALLPVLGGRRFLIVYSAAVVLGGACFAAVNWHANAELIGASAGVMALFIVFACLYPNQEMTFLLFFIVPVTIKPKYLAYLAVAIDLVGCLAYEVGGTPSPLSYAHSAHLGGMAAGWLYFRFIHEASWRLPSRRAAIELPKWMKHSQKTGASAPSFKVNMGSRENLRAEVDRILDKINSQGFGALTAEEKRILDEARDLLSRR